MLTFFRFNNPPRLKQGPREIRFFYHDTAAVIPNAPGIRNATSASIVA
jgi:hypothetical protein